MSAPHSFPLPSLLIKKKAIRCHDANVRRSTIVSPNRSAMSGVTGRVRCAENCAKGVAKRRLVSVKISLHHYVPRQGAVARPSFIETVRYIVFNNKSSA